jgi:SAM-dependent methyltransferase
MMSVGPWAGMGGSVVEGSRSRGFTQASIPDGYRRFMLRQLFEPWAAELVARAGLRPGQSVLDVASGLGPVARLAAAAVGPDGRVVASDISAPMLALAAEAPLPAGSAPIEYLECPAAEIRSGDDSFDTVLCQQGLQFFPDRGAALREMRRVLRVDGAVLVAVWAAEHPLGLFGPIAETLDEVGVAEPFPGAFDMDSFRVSVADLQDSLRAAGFRDVTVETVELGARWATADEATATLLGTPFAPLVSALPAAVQDQVRARLAGKLGAAADGVTVPTAANIARAVK